MTWHTMTKLGGTTSKPALILFLLLLGPAPVAMAGDLSRYRNFQLGTDLASVTNMTGAQPYQVKVVHRPTLIQELAWRPQPLGPMSTTESFRIAFNYIRYETEGPTSEDIVEAISANHGFAPKPADPSKVPETLYGDPDALIAQWQDEQYRFDLNRLSYGPVSSLVGVQKALEAQAEVATLEAKRLDNREAPQRAAPRIAHEEEAVRAMLEKARLVNKPKFRP
jgi:hypothetical protein